MVQRDLPCEQDVGRGGTNTAESHPRRIVGKRRWFVMSPPKRNKFHGRRHVETSINTAHSHLVCALCRYPSAAEPNPSAGWHASVPFMNIEVRRGMRLKLHTCPLSHRFLKIIPSWIILFVPVPEPNHAFTCSERGIILVTDLMSYSGFLLRPRHTCVKPVTQKLMTIWIFVDTHFTRPFIIVNFEKINSIAGRSVQRSGQFPYVSSMLDRLHLAVGYQKPETIQ
uniref:Uncharacterized protein n=1 Tax=Coccidioides posadasii RMSCC 3488 TaxID=454284 RepID=A0A0J6I3K9_COCPO|nr:hypothetical protein CPAG_02303 [Coccidioides posadasii RMSCC 3488]